ncbi:hypothetical protein [Ramlibacter sp.]|uniref:hypothetical protein n=1 Tax=Ramlibacter sp. TaxID=1917967 RepID=UPI003D143E88
MSSTNFQNLEKLGKLKPHEPRLHDVESSLRVGKEELQDAKRTANSLTTRYKAANDAAHGFLLIALMARGYRTTSDPGHRQVLYELLPVLVPGATAAKDSLDRAARTRNRLIYEGSEIDISEGMIEDVIDGAENVLEEVEMIVRKLRTDLAAKQERNSQR